MRNIFDFLLKKLKKPFIEGDKNTENYNVKSVSKAILSKYNDWKTLAKKYL